MAVLGFIGALLTGISLGLIGGGSILIVPILVYLFSVSPAMATAYSLFVVGFASAIGAFGKRDLIDYKVAGIFAIPSLAGVLLARRLLIPSLPEEIFTSEVITVTKDSLIMLVFAVVMLAASVSMVRKGKNGETQDENAKAEINAKAYPLIALEGLLVGGVTGFVGAGGGF